MFFAGLNNTAKTTIDGAAGGALQLGNWVIGGTPGADSVGATSTVVPDIQQTFNATSIKWLNFGAGKLNLYLEIIPTAPIDVGCMILYLSGGAPLAYGRFNQKIRLYPAGEDRAADRITICLSLRRTNISSKFTIPAEQSLNYAMPEFASHEAWRVAPQNQGLIKMQTEFGQRPAFVVFDKDTWLTNNFVEAGQDMNIISGGEVGDEYI